MMIRTPVASSITSSSLRARLPRPTCGLCRTSRRRRATITDFRSASRSWAGAERNRSSSASPTPTSRWRTCAYRCRHRLTKRTHSRIVGVPSMPNNGRLTAKQLSRIHHPKLELHLACDEASASWNTLRLFLLQRYGRAGEITAEGPLGAYRNFEGQVQCKTLFGRNAATPGRSNHGWGHAVDVATPEMAALIDRHGAPFGWHHWDAKWEWWHREYDGGFTRPDPGPDEKNPVLRKGSGGPGQSIPVTKLQRMLNRRANAGLDEDGDFGGDTRKALVAFQRAAGVTANGICDAETWALLAKAPLLPARKVAAAPKPKPRPKPVTTRDTLLRGFDVSERRGV